MALLTSAYKISTCVNWGTSVLVRTRWDIVSEDPNRHKWKVIYIYIFFLNIHFKAKFVWIPELLVWLLKYKQLITLDY